MKPIWNVYIIEFSDWSAKNEKTKKLWVKLKTINTKSKIDCYINIKKTKFSSSTN